MSVVIGVVIGALLAAAGYEGITWLAEWLARRRWLACRMRDLGLEPKRWQSNRTRVLEIMMLLTVPPDVTSQRGLTRYVARLLGVPFDRVSVSSDAPCSILIKVPARTRAEDLATVAKALDRVMPAEAVFRLECEDK